MSVRKNERDIIKKMQAIGTYKPSFEHTIKTLAKMLLDLRNAEESFEESGGDLIIEHTNKAGATNVIKNPYYQVIENLRQQIITYSRELGLTPAGLKKINDKATGTKKESALAKALSKLE